jgi:hypothetical protein
VKKIAVLSSDTAHHRYFLNTILKEGISLAGCLFETEHVEAPFPIGPLFETEEDSFEAEHFFNRIPRELPNGLTLEVGSVNSLEAAEKIRRLKPDFGVVFGTGKISKDVIQMFPDGLINVHRGIAEEYRGLDSDLWAIYHNDYKNIGVTIHKVEPLLDTGDVVLQERMELKAGMKTHQIRYYTSLIATDLVIKALKDYLSGTLKHRPQEKRGKYCSFMPLDLKKMVNEKFNNYCKKLDF